MEYELIRSDRRTLGLEVKRDGSVYLQLDVPFGASAEVEIGDIKTVCSSGHHSFRSGLPG